MSARVVWRHGLSDVARGRITFTWASMAVAVGAGFGLGVVIGWATAR